MEIVSLSQKPVRRVVRQARQIADPVARLRYLRGRLRMDPRSRRRRVPSWTQVLAGLTALAAVAAGILLWQEF